MRQERIRRVRGVVAAAAAAIVVAAGTAPAHACLFYGIPC